MNGGAAIVFRGAALGLSFGLGCGFVVWALMVASGFVNMGQLNEREREDLRKEDRMKEKRG